MSDIENLEFKNRSDRYPESLLINLDKYNVRNPLIKENSETTERLQPKRLGKCSKKSLKINTHEMGIELSQKNKFKNENNYQDILTPMRRELERINVFDSKTRVEKIKTTLAEMTVFPQKIK